MSILLCHKASIEGASGHLQILSKLDMMALSALIGAYYTFNMSYPQPLKAVMMLIQCIVLNFDDGERVLAAVTTICSSLDSIQL